MKTYLVFEPAEGGRTLGAAERVVFLREKFSWPALFFTPIWLLWNRLWLGFAGWVVLTAVIAAAGTALGFREVAGFAAAVLPSFIAAFEATTLKRRKLMRRRFREVGVVVAEDLESAERRFFAAWLADDETPPTPSSSSRLPPTPTSGVIGLFPEPGGMR